MGDDSSSPAGRRSTSGIRDDYRMNARQHRERQILEVVLRHGFGFLVEHAGPQHLLPPEHRRDRPGASSPERLRLALEELGPTFVKLGQILSTRADLLP